MSSANESSGVGELLLQIKEIEPTGRVIAEFDLDLIRNNKSLDTILEDGDTILIPQITQQVFVQGEVGNSGAIRYSPNMGIDYYVDRSGGFLQSADEENIFIVHPNGETENLNINSRLSFILQDSDKTLIYPGSIIFVPQKTNFATTLQVASIWAPIISSIALSLTSLSVLNNTN
jgi:protein involved in polysaccharide export with SLBB domain